MAHALAPGARYRSHRQAARRAGQWHGIFGHTREQAAHDRASAAGAATEKSSQTGSTFKRGRLPAQRRGGGGGGRTPAPSSSSSNRRARPLRAGVVCVCARGFWRRASSGPGGPRRRSPSHTHSSGHGGRRARAGLARALGWPPLGPALPFPPRTGTFTHTKLRQRQRPTTQPRACFFWPAGRRGGTTGPGSAFEQHPSRPHSGRHRWL